MTDPDHDDPRHAAVAPARPVFNARRVNHQLQGRLPAGWRHHVGGEGPGTATCVTVYRADGGGDKIVFDVSWMGDGPYDGCVHAYVQIGDALHDAGWDYPLAPRANAHPAAIATWATAVTAIVDHARTTGQLPDPTATVSAPPTRPPSDRTTRDRATRGYGLPSGRAPFER